MAKPNIIVSTCGTSLLTNEVESELRKILTRFANQSKAEDVPLEHRQRIQQHLDARYEDFIQETDLKHLMDLSAELNGVFRWYGGNPRITSDQHVLLATDTWLGESTAVILAGVIERYGHQVEIKRVPDLRTDDANSFRWAMSELVAWCAETLRGYRDAGYRVVFNLTGGFKSVQGFMQALGVKPEGTLTVTYTFQEVATKPTLAPAAKEKTCPKCAEQIKEAAIVCRYGGHQFA